jgi:tetraacyldisaccharide 4'-kinase
VLLDAARPFGNGLCLPAGDLREFRSGLARADLVLLTRAGAVSATQLEERIVRLRPLLRPGVAIHPCEHAPSDVLRQPDGAVLARASLAGQRVVLLSAIARPRSFRDTVAALGAEVVREFVHRDHHRFTPSEVAAAADAAQASGAWLLTTEKDDARLGAIAVPRYVLRIDLHFLNAAPSPEEFLL